eukprot:gene36991-48272_t
MTTNRSNVNTTSVSLELKKEILDKDKDSSGTLKDYVPAPEVDGQVVCPKAMDMGCGQLNPVANRRCKKCSVVLVSKTTNSDERLRLGQIVYFLRQSGVLIDKGILVGIAVGDDPDSVCVRYYEKVFRFPRYDEIMPLNKVYTSIASAIVTSGNRARKQTTMFEILPEAKRERRSHVNINVSPDRKRL